MKWIMTVRTEHGSEWTEDYADDDVQTAADAAEAGRAMIDNFNRGLKPGESKRFFV